MGSELWLVLGDQLFDPQHFKQAAPKVGKAFMAEDHGLCTHFAYHQHKLVLFLSGMRHFRQELEASGFEVEYRELGGQADRKTDYEQKLSDALAGVARVHSFEVSDRFFEARLETLFKKKGVQWVQHPSPGLVTPRQEFSSYLSSVKKPFMKTFYERNRKRLKLLVDADGDPEGGQFSFDEQNREALPDEIQLPGLPVAKPDATTQKVIALVESTFGSHPGKASEFWLPVTRHDARAWLADFIKRRLKDFGPYEDALSGRDPFLFHSVLTPFLNTGLLTPLEVIEAVLSAYRRRRIPLNSVEGFVRQVIGWREFVFGIDRHFADRQWNTNHWDHQRRLTRHWYEGTTGLPPLDEVIKKLQRWAYNHHIERLMIAGTTMLTCEVHPHEAYRWFMEMHLDSADWVMGPNVFGMGIVSDGGVFATKPYLCGSNYWLKMGDYAKGDWCDIADGLYWGFIARHQKELVKNPRMATIARSLDRIKSDRKEKLFRAADAFKAKVTVC